MVYCCGEHVDQALDEMVRKHETAPSFEKIDSVDNDPNSCVYCGKLAVYMVGNE
ncbi:CxxH/CxxC protein [Bacillus sp. B15-48]|uniref:CxxH/CxxC protein n=1 Tax=Bacillus sp. B15-48 TaxID=1548601 RepID=UPI00193FD283|nr:CxxH/CxxC protein [Bacillus sp. B15-48]MBM4761699.1 CxxH/CxxC protein [Bacillus sp. B15-48]